VSIEYSYCLAAAGEYREREEKAEV